MEFTTHERSGTDRPEVEGKRLGVLKMVAVKVVDIIGNDTMTIVDVSVGKIGGKK